MIRLFRQSLTLRMPAVLSRRGITNICAIWALNAEVIPTSIPGEYVGQLIEGQKDIQVDTITGATHSGDNFRKLVPAAIEQAKKGDSTTVQVE